MYKEDGFEEGRDTHLIEQVTKKLSKGCAPEVIADILEEPLESIQEICVIALKYEPDYDVKKILDEYIKIKNAQPV